MGKKQVVSGTVNIEYGQVAERATSLVEETRKE
jgi:hypothetical protein